MRSPTPPAPVPLLLLAALGALLLAAPPAHAQSDGGLPPLLGANTPEDPASPRVSVRRFLRLAREQRLAEAATYLELPRNTSPEQAAEAARKLQVVLDRRLGVVLENVSPLAGGDPDDALPRNVERLGLLTDPEGKERPVLLERREAAPAPADAGASGTPPPVGRWVFTSETVEQVPAWYAALHDAWMYERLPPVLLLPGPRGILAWQWGLLLALAVGAWLLGHLLGRLLERLFARLAARTANRWDDVLLTSVHRPLVAGCALLIYSVVVPLLDLSVAGREFIHESLKVAVFITFFWLLNRTLDALGTLIVASPWAQTRPASRSLVPLGRRVAKVILGTIAVVAVVNAMGYPVASLIAGLGIGGVALALAAQKTVENLFGAFSLGVDQPIREGDFVKVEDFTGTVESIGLRSTRIRTLDRTLISVPNGKLAEMRLESYTARDRFRLAQDIGLLYSTTPAQMREVLAGFEAVLRAQPKLWTESLTVRFKAFGESALLVEVMAWFEVPEWKDLQAIRQEVFLQFMEVVQKAGTGFAFPTRTVFLVDGREGSGARREAPAEGPASPAPPPGTGAGR
jgi:MscS family membrane protein